MTTRLTNVRNMMAGTALAFAASAGHAAPIVLGFDGVAPGSTANSAAAGAGLRFDLAGLLPLLDGAGDPIPGSEAYRVDPDAIDSVRVGNPSVLGYGNAPSPVNALDAIDQGLLITFDSVVDLSSFAVTLDLSAFGFPGVFDIVFQDELGTELQRLPTSQSIAGFTAAIAGPLSSVRSVYLPSGAFYDDLSFEVVPEPGTALLMLLGLAGLASTRANGKR